MTRRRASRPLGALAALALLAGCQSAQTTAAHKIADALPRSLGPAAHYEVQVEGDTFGLARGRARRVHIIGEQVRVIPDMTLDMLDVDAHDVSFDMGARRIEGAGQAVFIGTIGQRNLSNYLTRRPKFLPGAAVQLQERDVLAEVPIMVAGLHTTAVVSGTLAPDPAQRSRLDFIADAASLGRLPIPARLVNLALGEINPVFDLSRVRVPIALARADVINHQMVLQGTAHLDNLRP
ncbi:MAG: LmeA family phospholipid-binding protein [Armatimonadetes bacterium]|nr:LmeA family phospholipid-binding protein [Armatimonadota bacterium]